MSLEDSSKLVVTNDRSSFVRYSFQLSRSQKHNLREFDNESSTVHLQSGFAVVLLYCADWGRIIDISVAARDQRVAMHIHIGIETLRNYPTKGYSKYLFILYRTHHGQSSVKRWL